MFLTKQLIVGKGLYSSHHLTEILHLSHFCHSFCSAKCSWRKRGEREFSPPIYFFLLPIFSSFVFLPPSNVNNARYLVCLFFPPISFLGEQKANFRSFPYLYGFYIFFVKKNMVHWLGGIWSLAIHRHVFTDLLLGGGGPLKGNWKNCVLLHSHQKINRGKSKRKNCTRLSILLEDWTEPAEMTQVLSFNCNTSCKEASAKHGFRSDARSDELEKGICLDTAILFQGQLFLTYSDSHLLRLHLSLLRLLFRLGVFFGRQESDTCSFPDSGLVPACLQGRTAEENKMWLK